MNNELEDIFSISEDEICHVHRIDNSPTILSNSVIKDTKLSCFNLGLLLRLKHLANKHLDSELLYEFGQREYIDKGLAQLIKLGYVVITKDNDIVLNY